MPKKSTSKIELELESYVDAPQIAKHLKVSLQSVYNWVSTGQIPCYRISRNLVRFKITEVEVWLKQFHQKVETLFHKKHDL